MLLLVYFLDCQLPQLPIATGKSIQSCPRNILTEAIAWNILSIPGKMVRVAQPSTLQLPMVWWRWWRAYWELVRASPLLTTVETPLPWRVPSMLFQQLCQIKEIFQRDEDTATCLAMILALYLSTPTSETRKSLRSIVSSLRSFLNQPNLTSGQWAHWEACASLREGLADSLSAWQSLIWRTGRWKTAGSYPKIPIWWIFTGAPISSLVQFSVTLQNAWSFHKILSAFLRRSNGSVASSDSEYYWGIDLNLFIFHQLINRNKSCVPPGTVKLETW